jgi:glycine/D-amino acid oxidase-like deaminating enzyme
MTADVVVIGGGVIGSSVAWHLRRLGVPRVVVIERDTTYVRASSTLAFGGVRQLYGTRPGIELARRSVAAFKAFDDLVAAAGHGARIDFDQHGWLYLVDRAHADRAERRLAFQRTCGASAERLPTSEVGRRVPGLALEDVAFGILGPEDGTLTSRAVLQGLRALAIDAGATFLTGEVIGLRVDVGRVAGIALSTGDYVASERIVCAAGAYSASVGALADVAVPVVPVRQQLFRAALPPGSPWALPAIVTPPGVYWRYQRPEAPRAPAHIICGWTESDVAVGERFEVAPERWTDVVVPMLARYMPAYAGVEVVSSWAGLYEMTADSHPLLGEHAAVHGFFLACGFSGHGLMLSPAVGETLASLIVSGTSAIDVSAFAPDRFARRAPLDPDDLS